MRRRRHRSRVPSSTTPSLISQGLEAGAPFLAEPPASVKITAEFVTSAAHEADFPRDGQQEVAMVGRSNVGKSSLINALVRQRVARTSAAPGKTRLPTHHPRPPRAARALA